MNFQAFNFDARVAAGVDALGYTVPTPIQAQAIPPILQGHDVMGLAQTGTGKTAAFVLPILQRLLTGPRGQVRALIIAPTRELVDQIHAAIKTMGAQTRLRSCTIYGGVSVGPQIAQLRSGVEIVVACPGRLLDHIGEQTIALAKLEVLVLDEADHMFDMGFLPDIRRILRVLPPQRQTLLFSATMPTDIRRLADDILHNPIHVQVGSSAPIETVAHALYPVVPTRKTALLMELLHQTDTESVLIFTRTKHRAKHLGEQLGAAGYRAATLQGNLSQNRRQEAIGGFRDGSYQILVATDIAARGIDVSGVSHVINYDIPDTTDAYTHRIGRTGRAAHTGDAFTLVTDEDTIMVRAIERVLGSPIPVRRLAGFDYSTATPDRPPAPRPPRPVQRHAPKPSRPAPAPAPTPASQPAPAPAPARSRRPARRAPAQQTAAPAARYARA